MTYFTQDTITASVEIEFLTDKSLNEIKSSLDIELANNLEIKYDATPTDGSLNMIEINISPMIVNAYFHNVLENIENELTRLNVSVNRKCGLHVHIGTRPVLGDITPHQFNELSFKKFKEEPSEVKRYIDYTRQIPLLAIQDVISRYNNQIEAVKNMVAPSRWSNRYAYHPCQHNHNWLDDLNSATSYVQIARYTRDKFTNINLHNLRNDKETIEFRQHHGTINAQKIYDWCAFLVNLFTHTINNRISNSEATMVETTVNRPDANDVFRQGTAKNIMMRLMSRSGGATTRELQIALGNTTPENVRARISELRNRLGQQSVTTHTQQYYSHIYGASNGLFDLGGYEMPETYTRSEQSESTEQLLPPNRIASDSIFASLDDNIYNRLNARGFNS